LRFAARELGGREKLQIRSDKATDAIGVSNPKTWAVAAGRKD
jgi:hypothetical protein